MTRIATVAALAALTVVPAVAQAADPGRWVETSTTSIATDYFQGMASDAAGSLFYAGRFTGIARTDAKAMQQARRPDVFPADVKQREGYNHIGDIDWDAPGGVGRLLLPVECFYPGQPDANTCKTGAFAVVDPQSLNWLYYVKLDPASIPKAMWVAASPDGLLWTSAGDDLLAFNAADVNPANAAPNGPAIPPVRRLAGAAAGMGVTGGVFHEGRLFLAGPAGNRFIMRSVDPVTGVSQLEIERAPTTEAEGIDVAPVLGGVLHWIVVTGGLGSPNTLLSYLPRNTALKATARRSRRNVTVTVKAAGVAVPGVTVRLAGKRAKTNAAGRATLKKLRRGRHRGRASRLGLRTSYFAVRV